MVTHSIKKTCLLWILVMLAAESYACPCFNQYYLYSIFYSEKNDFNCRVISDSYNDPDSRIVSMTSIYRGAGHIPSNYGEVHSHSNRCELLIDDQIVSIQYTSPKDKPSCDKAITQACDSLKLKSSKWPNGK